MTRSASILAPRPRRIALLVAVASACLGAAAVPPAAQAVPPGNDNYLDSTRVNEPGTVLPGFSSHTGNTLESTVQADILEGRAGGPIAETTGCLRSGFPEAIYNTTVWWDIYPHRPGKLSLVVESFTFQAMVGVMPFDAATTVPNVSLFRCGVASLGRAVLDYEFRLQEGAAYTIQIGGVSGTAGPYRLDVHFDPDTDRDGLLDSADACDEAGGGAATGGCPDGDGDGVIDASDRCQGPHGPAAQAGCPDADGDGRIDPDDACRTQSTRGQRDRNDNGCPDREFLKPEVQLTPGSYCRGSLCLGLAMDKLVVSQIPRGTRVSVSCSRKACRTASKRAGRSRRVRFFSGQKLRAGVKVFVKVTKKGRVGRQVTYLIKRNDLHKGRLRCLSGGRATGCSTKLLIR